MKNAITLMTIMIVLTGWFYLAGVARTIHFHDALGYQESAVDILDKGFVNYLQTGPNREPLYPLFLAMSKWLAESLAMDEQKVLFMMHSCIMAVTLILMVLLMQQLSIKDGWMALAVGYFGISPSVVNTGFISWSEILTYPLVLGVILSIVSYGNIQWFSISRWKVVALAVIHAWAWVLLMMIKAPAEILFYGWACCLGIFLFKDVFIDKKRMVNKFIFIIVVVGIVLSGIIGYKYANWYFNGQWTLTNRASWALYGNTARRVATSLDKEDMLAILLTIPQPSLCSKYLTIDKCQRWGFEESDRLAFEKMAQLRKNGVPESQLPNKLMQSTMDIFWQRPGQVIALSLLEGLKLFFWEYNAVMEYNAFPNWVNKFYQNPIINERWRLLMAALTMIVFFYTVLRLLKRLKILSRQERVLAIIILFISAWIFVYMPFFVSGRYSMPLAGLWVILIVYNFQLIFSSKMPKIYPFIKRN